jgi:hypothetical protein
MPWMILAAIGFRFLVLGVCRKTQKKAVFSLCRVHVWLISTLDILLGALAPFISAF